MYKNILSSLLSIILRMLIKYCFFELRSTDWKKFECLLRNEGYFTVPLKVHFIQYPCISPAGVDSVLAGVRSSKVGWSNMGRGKFRGGESVHQMSDFHFVIYAFSINEDINFSEFSAILRFKLRYRVVQVGREEIKLTTDID